MVKGGGAQIVVLKLDTKVLAILKWGGKKFPPLQRGVWKLLPRLEGGHIKFRTRDFPISFCRPPPCIVINDQSPTLQLHDS